MLRNANQSFYFLTIPVMHNNASKIDKIILISFFHFATKSDPRK
jgi:hypothetical protein